MSGQKETNAEYEATQQLGGSDFRRLLGSTNSDLPFRPNEIISFAGDKYQVVKNWGDDGDVREYPGGEDVFPFLWRFEGEDCVRAESS